MMKDLKELKELKEYLEKQEKNDIFTKRFVDRDQVVSIIHHLFEVEQNPTEAEIISLVKSLEMFEV